MKKTKMNSDHTTNDNPWEWIDTHLCDWCKQPLKPVYDEISKKISDWTFNCDCEGWPKGVVKSIG